MGAVYLAEDDRLGRRVAIKFLPPDVDREADVIKRFEREARAVAALDHPNIVTIHEIGVHEGRHFIVMSYVEGDRLRDLINTGSISTRRAVDITLQLCGALEDAHGTGIVHRDLKPENIIVDAKGRAQVLDFGLAMAMGATRLTHEGRAVGTLHYMSPEQSRGDSVDGRSDIFSLGAVFYEMISGRPPFSGDHPAAVQHAIATETPHPLARYSSDVTPELERITAKALSKDPDLRYQTMADLAADLRALDVPRPGSSDTRVVPARRAGPRRASLARYSIAVGGIAVAIVAFMLGRALDRDVEERPAAPRSVRASIPPPEGGSFDLHPVQPGPVAVSPDGTRLVYAARGRDRTVRLWVRPLNGFEAYPLDGTTDATYPFWSPDSRWVAFFAGGKLKKIDAGGGPVVTIASAAYGMGGDWGPGDVILFAASRSSPILRVSAAGGDPVAVTEVSHTRDDNGHVEPRFLPDGRHFLYVACTGLGITEEGHHLMIGSLDGDPPRELMRTSSQVEFGGGRLWFVREGTLLSCPFDVDRGEITGEAIPVADGAVYSGWAAWFATGYFSVSPAGVIAYHTGRPVSKSVLTWYDRSGHELSTVGSRENQYHISISPDRTRAAVQIEKTGEVIPRIWMYDLDRGVKDLVTPDASASATPVWSPDGKRIAFGSTRGGALDVYIKPVAGGEATPLFAVAAGRDSARAARLAAFDADWALDWSSDGRYLVYCDAADSPDLWALSLQGDEDPIPIRRTPFDEEDAALSPDGRWLAYTSNRPGRLEVYLTDFPRAGVERRVSTDGGIRPEWSPKGDELFYLAPDNVLTSVHIGTDGDEARIGKPRPLFSVDVRHHVYGEPGGYAVGKNGERFLVNRVLDTGTVSPLRVIVGWPDT